MVDIKKTLIIIYLILISVGIYAIGVGVVRDIEKEKILIMLEGQYRQKKQPVVIKTSSKNLYQNFYEAKIVWDKNQAEVSSVAVIAENKANQEEIDRIAAESKEAAESTIIKSANQAKIKASKIETNRLAKIETDKLAKIEVDRLAKIEADNLAKIAADLLIEEADKEVLEAEALEKQLLEEDVLKENKN